MLRLALLALAAWALHGELAGLDRGLLMAELRGFGASRLVLAAAATVASFVVLGGIELMALRYVNLSAVVPRGAGMMTGFVANALSQTIGITLLTGGAVRVRAYRRFGVGGWDIAQLSGFVTLTIALGLMATGAGAFLASSTPLQVGHHEIRVRPVGALLAATVLAYLAWSALGKHDSVGWRGWRVARPSSRLAVEQVAVASLDWLVTGSLLFLVLPPVLGVGFLRALRVYLVAQTVGTASHVPGGAGVFDLMVLALLVPLAGAGSRAAIVAALIAFRVLYYLIPLVVACLVAVVAEMRAPGLANAA